MFNFFLNNYIIMNHLYDINGNYYSGNNRIVEHLISAGNSTKIKDSTMIKKINDTEKNINQSMVIAGMTKMLSSVMNDIANENAAELTQMIALSNSIEITKIKTKGTFTLKSMKQDGSVDSTSNIKSQQKIQNKISSEVSKKLSSKITSVVDDLVQKDKDVQIEENKGTNLGDVVKTIGSTIANVMSVSAGNSTSKDISKEVIDETKTKLNLDKSFKLKKDKEVSDKISNTLSSKNMAKCAKDSKQENKFKLEDIEAGAGVDLGSLEQKASIKTVLNCAFNQEILSDIATRIVNDFDENIKRMQKSADMYAEKKRVKSTSGDIYAAGVAGKAILQGVGEAAIPIGKGISAAAEGIGKGVSTAAEGVGKGVSTGAQGIGKGIGSALGGLVMPLAIAGVVIVIIGIVFAVIKMKARNNDD